MHGIDQDFTDYPPKPAAKMNEHDQFFGDSGCQTDRDHQDHTAFGIEIERNLRFQNFKRDKNIVKK